MTDPQTPPPLPPDSHRILRRLQASIPLLPRPWDVLAEELGLAPEYLLEQVRCLCHTGRIRRIAGYFSAERLGYRQALVAMRVDSESLEPTARLACSHPGVSHCYARDHEWNLWLTLAVSPQSRLGLEGTVDIFRQHAAHALSMILPSERRFKLSARFDPERGTLLPAEEERDLPTSNQPPRHCTPQQKKVIRALQTDLPITQAPYEELARPEGLDLSPFLAEAVALLDLGVMRRYAARVAHRRAGARANVMVAWVIPEDLAESVGLTAAASPDVSHCYLRPSRPGWPYRLYTMIHGPDRDYCHTAIERLASEIPATDKALLWTARGFCKKPVEYMTDSEDQWEQQFC